MKPPSYSLLYFSPTGTTKTVCEAILSGTKGEIAEIIDLTRLATRQSRLSAPWTIEGDIVVIGMPVYEERIPRFLYPLMENLQGLGQAAVIIAVYGNVGYGIALQQLAFYCARAKFKVIGGAAFIGEHSFSHSSLRIAEGRPNTIDLDIATEFGKALSQKLLAFPDLSRITLPPFPGHLPLQARILPKDSAKMFTFSPNVYPEKCTHCKACVKSCPMQAIGPIALEIAETKCIRCFACVRVCKFGARSIKLKKSWLVHKVLKKSEEIPRDNRIF